MKNSQTAGVASSAREEAHDPAFSVKRDLEAAETKLSRLLDSNEAIIGEICHYLVDAGGKRRPETFVEQGGNLGPHEGRVGNMGVA